MLQRGVSAQGCGSDQWCGNSSGIFNWEIEEFHGSCSLLPHQDEDELRRKLSPGNIFFVPFPTTIISHWEFKIYWLFSWKMFTENPKNSSLFLVHFFNHSKAAEYFLSQVLSIFSGCCFPLLGSVTLLPRFSLSLTLPGSNFPEFPSSWSPRMAELRIRGRIQMLCFHIISIRKKKIEVQATSRNKGHQV